MKNVSFITDETKKRRYAQLDLKKIAHLKHDELEEILDIIIAEARRDDEKISIEEFEKQL